MGTPSEYKYTMTRFLPAAKCSGVLFLPAVSLELTFSGVRNFFTLSRSPFLHASKREDCLSPSFPFDLLGIVTGTAAMFFEEQHAHFCEIISAYGRMRETPSAVVGVACKC